MLSSAPLAAVHQRTFSEPDLSSLSHGSTSSMRFNQSEGDLERIANQRRGDREEEELLQARATPKADCPLPRPRARTRVRLDPPEVAHPLTPPAPLLHSQAVLRASAMSSNASDVSSDDGNSFHSSSSSSSPRSSGKKTEEHFDPLDIGETPSFDEIFG